MEYSGLRGANYNNKSLYPMSSYQPFENDSADQAVVNLLNGQTRDGRPREHCLDGASCRHKCHSTGSKNKGVHKHPAEQLVACLGYFACRYCFLDKGKSNQPPARTPTPDRQPAYRRPARTSHANTHLLVPRAKSRTLTKEKQSLEVSKRKR